MLQLIEPSASRDSEEGGDPERKLRPLDHFSESSPLSLPLSRPRPSNWQKAHFLPSGEVAVADKHNHRVQAFDREGNYLRQFGTQGGEDGQFLYPSGEFTADAHGNTLVTDIYTIRLQVFNSKGGCLCTNRDLGLRAYGTKGVAWGKGGQLAVANPGSAHQGANLNLGVNGTCTVDVTAATYDLIATYNGLPVLSKKSQQQSMLQHAGRFRDEPTAPTTGDDEQLSDVSKNYIQQGSADVVDPHEMAGLARSVLSAVDTNHGAERLFCTKDDLRSKLDGLVDSVKKLEKGSQQRELPASVDDLGPDLTSLTPLLGRFDHLKLMRSATCEANGKACAPREPFVSVPPQGTARPFKRRTITYEATVHDTAVGEMTIRDTIIHDPIGEPVSDGDLASSKDDATSLANMDVGEVALLRHEGIWIHAKLLRRDGSISADEPTDSVLASEMLFEVNKSGSTKRVQRGPEWAVSADMPPFMGNVRRTQSGAEKSAARRRQEARKSAENDAEKKAMWTAKGWLTSLGIVSELAHALLDQAPGRKAGGASGGADHQDTQIKSLSEDDIDNAIDNASVALKDMLKQEIKKLKSMDEVSPDGLNAKFQAEGKSFTLGFGDVDIFHGGLEARIGAPSPNVEEEMFHEHCEGEWSNVEFELWNGYKTTAKKEWEYVDGKAEDKGSRREINEGRIREQGRNGWALGSFMVRYGRNSVQIVGNDKEQLEGKTGELFYGESFPMDMQGQPACLEKLCPKKTHKGDQLPANYWGHTFLLELHDGDPDCQLCKAHREKKMEIPSRPDSLSGWRSQNARDYRRGNRIAVQGKYLRRHDLVHRSKLQLAEVRALRLYTGPMFKWYNDVLRHHTMPAFADWICPTTQKVVLKKGQCWVKVREERKIPHPFVTTLHVLNSAIVKLQKVQRVDKVYRGVSGGTLPEKFMQEDAMGVRGGIELAFMSTTRKRQVAVEYASSGGMQKPSVVFEIQMGMIDRGAAVQWCSQFPEEEEILFAPLAALEVSGTPAIEDGHTIVVPLKVNCNLHDLTIEQLTAKMRKSHLDLVDMITNQMKQALEQVDNSERYIHVLTSHRDEMLSMMADEEKEERAREAGKQRNAVAATFVRSGGSGGGGVAAGNASALGLSAFGISAAGISADVDTRRFNRGKWFNKAEHYRLATKLALDRKYEACWMLMKDTSDFRELSAKGRRMVIETCMDVDDDSEVCLYGCNAFREIAEMDSGSGNGGGGNESHNIYKDDVDWVGCRLTHRKPSDFGLIGESPRDTWAAAATAACTDTAHAGKWKQARVDVRIAACRALGAMGSSGGGGGGGGRGRRKKGQPLHANATDRKRARACERARGYSNVIASLVCNSTAQDIGTVADGTLSLRQRAHSGRVRLSSGDSDPNVRLEACRALGRMGEAADSLHRESLDGWVGLMHVYTCEWDEKSLSGTTAPTGEQVTQLNEWRNGRLQRLHDELGKGRSKADWSMLKEVALFKGLAEDGRNKLNESPWNAKSCGALEKLGGCLRLIEGLRGSIEQWREHASRVATRLVKVRGNERSKGTLSWAEDSTLVREAACYALAKFGEAGAEHAGVVADLLGSGSGSGSGSGDVTTVVRAACQTLAKMGAKGADYADRIAELADERYPDVEVRETAKQALIAMSREGSQAAAKRVTEAGASVQERIAAVKTLRLLKKEGLAHIQEVIRLLDTPLTGDAYNGGGGDGEALVVEACATLAAMCRVGGSHVSEATVSQVADAVARLLSAVDPRVRLAACEALTSCRAAGARHVNAVAARLGGEQFNLWGRQATGWGVEINASLEDADGAVRAAACTTLAAMGKDGLRNWDPPLGEDGKMGQAASATSLSALVASKRTDADPLVRKAAEEAVRRIAEAEEELQREEQHHG
eukprot:g490.t1